MSQKIQDLLQELDTSRDTVAVKVIGQLKKIGKPALPLLLTAAQNPAKIRIQKWSLRALGSIGDKKVFPYCWRRSKIHVCPCACRLSAV